MKFHKRKPLRKLDAWLFLFWIAAGLLMPVAVLADDCARDFRRAEDCLRTPGFAQGIVTTVGTIVTVLVNGTVIAKTLIAPTDGSTTADGNNDPQTEYTLDVRSQDGRTDLMADGSDSLWVYAAVMCNKPEVDAAGLTASVRFSVDGPNKDWIKLGEVQFSGDFSLSRLRPPRPQRAPRSPTATPA